MYLPPLVLSFYLSSLPLHEKHAAGKKDRPQGGTVEDENGEYRGFGIYVLNGRRADKSEQC
eukprot:4197104-Pyramimonas_sp.AAC.1